MAKPLTIADKCLTLLVAVLVITNIILACSIGLVLPRHITKDGWIYIDDIDGATNESLRISCTCSRVPNVMHRGNDPSHSRESKDSNRRLECLMNGTGFKCFNPLSRNESQNISIETLPKREKIEFEPQDYSVIEKSIRVTSVKEEKKGELTHDVLKNNIDSSKSAKDLLVHNSSISSITSSHHTDKPSILTRLYSSTLSGNEGTTSNSIVVSRESVKTPKTFIEKYPYIGLAQGIVRHTTEQTMNMEIIIPDELTGEHTQNAEKGELMGELVLRNNITSSKSTEDSLFNNLRVSNFTESYHTEKTPIVMRLHQATLAGEVNTFQSNVFVAKRPVEPENHSYMRVSQETTHHMTDEAMNLKTKIPDKSTVTYTQNAEQTRVQKKTMEKAVKIPTLGGSSGINTSSSSELPSNLKENVEGVFNPDDSNDAKTEH